MDEKKKGGGKRSGGERRAPLEVNPSGAPEAGGATTPGSQFGGGSLIARLLRAIARVARTVEAAAYRRLRDLDQSAGEPRGTRGRPNRVREAATFVGRRPQPV
jgi:hypothetical protein